MVLGRFALTTCRPDTLRFLTCFVSTLARDAEPLPMPMPMPILDELSSWAATCERT